MKKSLLTTLVLTAMSASAFAAGGSISMDTRTDFEATNYNDAARNRDTNRFNVQTLRLDAKGNFTEDTSFRIRYRLTNPSSGNNTSNRSALNYNLRDSANTALDYGYIQHKFMDNLSVQMGKLNTDIGGIEGMTSGPDLYFQSQAYQDQSPLRYATGAKLMYMFADQEVDLMSTNQESDPVGFNTVGAGTSFAQTHQAWGLIYKGSFLDKSLMPVLSWHNDNVQATTAGGTGVENNFYAAGLKYDFAPFFLEADYLYDTYKNRTTAEETDKLSTIAATVGGRMDNWVLKLKYENSNADVKTTAATTEKNKWNGYQAAVEYLPTGDKNMRYHVAYVSRDFEPGTAALSGGTGNTDKQNTQAVFVGFRLLADFLK